MPVLQTNPLAVRHDEMNLFFSYCLADQDFVVGLIAYLKSYVARGLFSMIENTPGELDVRLVDSLMYNEPVFKEKLNQKLDAANPVIVLLSPEYLACRGSDETVGLLREKSNLGISIRPIVLRPCFWQDSGFADFNPAVGPDVPAYVGMNTVKNETYELILQEILRVIPISAIFRPVGQPDLSFIVPEKQPQLIMALGQLQRGLAVEGPSGIGKTTAVRHALGEAMIRLSFVPQITWIDAKKENNRQELFKILDDDFSRAGYLVIDDFHHLGNSVQRRVANLMKIIADGTHRRSKVVIIGISPIDASLLREFSELGGRISTIRMVRQPDRKIDELIRKGEEIANIRFDERQKFVQEAKGSFYMAQEICYSACELNGIDCIQPNLTVIHSSDIPRLIEKIHEDLSAKYYDGICKMATRDELDPPRGATVALMWLLRKANTQNVSIRDAKAYYPELKPAFEWLVAGELAELIRADEALRRRFYYREKTQILSIDDPQLEFYFRHLDWEKFLDDTRQTDIAWDPRKGVVQSPQAGQRTLLARAKTSAVESPKINAPSGMPRRRKKPQRIRILFLASSPDDLPRTSVPASGQIQEARVINDRLRGTQHAKMFEFKQHWALQAAEISRALLEGKPTVVHFCGEGDTQGNWVLSNNLGIGTPLQAKVIINTFKVLSSKLGIKCVVLMACFSEKIAKNVSNYVDAVIGINKSINHLAAITFVGQFYEALGYGVGVATAFELGKLALSAEDIPDEAALRLYGKPGVDLETLVLAV